MVLTLSEDEMYEIVLRRDKDFDGVFFYGAYDSEVYCLPSCSGRSRSARRSVSTAPARRPRRRATARAGAATPKPSP
ncbi:hypothetical protein AUQ37_05590 [Candidatus Methanomethylophilus sp. 1R26]|nr:Ada metal-binding domain-containing protein [Candidatus Methanomethylophilus sp. 1R26]KUE74147.1 hypothetical protein AUQ37_05590 [Candidatus Methanomethylophilus sp. 1R26]